MATMFDPMGRSHAQRARTWKLTAAGIAVLLLAGASVLGYTIYSGSHHAIVAGTQTPAAGGAPIVAIGTVAGSSVAPVEAPIRLANANGLGSASFVLTYDPAIVTLVGVQNGNVPQSQLTWRHDATTGTVVMLVTTALPKGAVGDSTLAVVTLKAVDGAVGKISPLAVAMRSAASATGSPIAVTPASGSFHNGVPGDVNGDGAVTKDDYERLADFLVGDDVPIVALNADLNGDGHVTDADAILLHQRLAATEAS